MNSIDINGVYNTVPMANVPQGGGFDDLLAFIRKDLTQNGYRGVSQRDDNLIVYGQQPKNVMRSAYGYHVHAQDREETIYVRLMSEAEYKAIA
jgi:hypothetical protein